MRFLNIAPRRVLHGTAESRGVALVIVLGFLVIISVLIIAFFTSVKTELSSATNYADGASAKMLADSAIHLVQAQIRDATRGRILGWASQPGMLRTFTATGELRHVYKLYSADELVVPAAEFTPDLDALPGDWNSGRDTDLYTDLNAPVLNAAGQLIYPIVDPSAADFVEGFAITQPPGYNSSKPASAVNNPAPMPVKWLYLLQDGTLIAASAQDATAVSVPGAAATNPIVGRVAFWTDDETAKVNINTASEGVYWDVPRVFSIEDVGLYAGTSTAVAQPGMAISQPAQREYQRYPGHPATTCLSPIFGHADVLPVPFQIDAGNASQLDPYYAIAPRVVGGGSEGGTRLPSGALAADKDRLYASIDELMFTPKLTGDSRVPNTAPGNSARPNLITREVLERAKFFITASSSAPETTLFNTPRVAIWPVHKDERKRTAYDKLLAFCSTTGGGSYYFTRSNPRSSTEDFTPRNQLLYQYLQALTARNVPGFGGNFRQKYTTGPWGISERDQILTSIYDYIRCVNLADSTEGATPYTPIFDAPNLSIDARDLYPHGAGEVVPIRIGGTKGFGRFHSIAEADLVFYATNETSPGKTDKMKAVFLMEFASPMHGLGGLRSGLKYSVIGLDQFKVAPKDAEEGDVPRPLGFPPGGTNFIDNSDLQTHGGRSVGGTEGPAMGLSDKWNNTKKLTTPGAAVRWNYPFFTGEDFSFTPPAAGSPTFVFKGGEVTVQIGTADTGELIQTVHLSFPDGEFKTPTLGSTPMFNARINVTGGGHNMIRPEDTVVGLEPAGLRGNDPLPEMDPTAGDLRMIEALPEIPSTRFRAHQGYTTPGVQKAYGAAWATGQPYPGATFGKLVNVPSYNGNIRNPDVPSRVGNFVTRQDGGPGDWDTGMGDQKDGAYINKPDEGDARFLKGNGTHRIPYILGNVDEFAPAGQTHFSPNRQMPSALMFGSIPTGVQRVRPWETLLFHARPEDRDHPGRLTPPDHLLADLFWMPVVEPYAISQPFATSGKINMNYQIEPFTYIRRDTGLQAVLKSTKFMALELGDGARYKPLDPTNTGARLPARRRAIDVALTLQAFDTKFSNNDVFKSATEICEIDLIPPGVTANGMANFWRNHGLTGDNLREKPYVDIYPRLTTKSNTYTVHVRVQSLKKARNTPPDQWVHARDRVAAEYRGSSLIERYIDVNDPRLPDFAKLATTNPEAAELNIDQYYRMRVISTKRFSP